jgi:hypothetical protein
MNKKQKFQRLFLLCLLSLIPLSCVFNDTQWYDFPSDVDRDLKFKTALWLRDTNAFKEALYSSKITHLYSSQFASTDSRQRSLKEFSSDMIELQKFTSSPYILTKSGYHRVHVRTPNEMKVYRDTVHLWGSIWYTNSLGKTFSFQFEHCPKDTTWVLSGYRPDYDRPTLSPDDE